MGDLSLQVPVVALRVWPDSGVPLMTGREVLMGTAPAAAGAVSSKTPTDAAARNPRRCCGEKRARRGSFFLVLVEVARGSRTLPVGTSRRPGWRSALLSAAGIRPSRMTSDGLRHMV